MTLHLIYRSYGGENTKHRPPYYSKWLTLCSFVRAVEELARQRAEPDVIFVNDGPIPGPRLELMHASGRVLSMGDTPAGMRASYRYAVHLPAREGWPDDDVVMFVEDDYLFTADAFVALADAAAGLSAVHYFALYGERPDYADPVDRRRLSVPDGWHPQPDLRSQDRVWFNLASTTSTFAARVGALRADMDIVELCLGPFRKRFLDHETCLIVQGAIPYRGAQLITGLDDLQLTPRGLVRALVLVPYRARLNRRARGVLRPHLLYGLTPNEATHLDTPALSPDRDWAAEAALVTAWSAERLSEEGSPSGR